MQMIFRKYRPLAFLPVLTWLTMQILMTGILPSSSAVAAAGDLSLSGVICTPTGVKYLSADDTPINPGDTSEQECDWCQAFGTSALPDRAASVAKVAFYVQRYTWPQTTDLSGSDEFSGKTTAIRAPPL